jgi:hypothetical protein
MFSKWGNHAPELAPALGISAAYVFLLIPGHGAMRAMTGPSTADRIVARSWE